MIKVCFATSLGVIAWVLGSATSTLAQTVQTATTPVLPSETITGVPTQMLPTPPVLTSRFTLPLDVRVAKDASITTNTPITDKYSSDISKWGELVSGCSRQKPVMLRFVDETSVPFMVGTDQGTVQLNANDKPVCSV